jgi:hypothetical protein
VKTIDTSRVWLPLALAKPGTSTVTQDNFPAVIAAVERAADNELGPGTGRPAARPAEMSRYRE